MNYGPWTARENHAFVKALLKYGAAFHQNGVSFTEA